ncbi:hypothetical protein GGR08_001366 [Bartonella fuyuanensis]|uniref:Uncharacterized protein n=1 Tax=Bartonella fuyuanensis TaxID=1460968 RepID=A0A840DVU8_9HYPH|nr:hypothetical protein [Bartonella fuyuanensis]
MYWGLLLYEIKRYKYLYKPLYCYRVKLFSELVNIEISMDRGLITAGFEGELHEDFLFFMRTFFIVLQRARF